MINVSVDTTGLQRAIEKITQMKVVVSDFSPETQKIGTYLLQFLAGDVFSSEGEAYGSRWAALNPIYAAYKAKKFPGGGILVASGQMRSSYKMISAADYMVIGNETSYAPYHQMGTSRMPKRVMALLDTPRMQEIIRIIITSLSERLMA